MTWILIIMLVSGGRPATTTATFTTQGACQAAAQQVKDAWGSAFTYTVCVSSGDKS